MTNHYHNYNLININYNIVLYYVNLKYLKVTLYF